jgi:hypothetical protein
MGIWIVGALIAVLALVGMWVWLRSYRERGVTPPTEREPDGLPEDRPKRWDPRERYE